MKSRRRTTSSSVRSRARLFGSMPVAAKVSTARVRPIPKMYVSAISVRFSRGRSTPTRRAIGGRAPHASWRSGPVPIPPAPAGPGLQTGGSPSRLHRDGWNGRLSCLTLALLVARVLTNDHDPAVAPDDPALVADLLDARLDLHGLPNF